MSANKLDDKDVMNILIDTALSSGASAADCVLSRSRGVSLTRRLGKDETIERYEDFDTGLRVFVGNKIASVSTNENSETAIKDVARRAVDMAKIAPQDDFSLIASQEILEEFPINEALSVDSYDKVEPNIDIIRDRAKEVEDTALSVKGITNSDGADASWGEGETLLMTSNGFFGCSKKSNHSVSVVVIAEKNGKMERDYDYSSKVFGEDLKTSKQIGLEAANKTLARMGATKPVTGKYPVIFDPRVSRSIASHFASAINGSAIARKTSFLKDMLNKQVANTSINIVDDPFLERGLGSRLFDAEGLGSRKYTLIKDGVLQQWLLDLSSAKQLNLKPFGNAKRGISGPPSPGTSNFMILPGKITPENLIKGISNGFYVTDMIGSSVSMITGDYSRGASGFWIKNGKLSMPITEATIAGNLKEMFMTLQPANDLDFSHSMNSPTLLIEGMTIAGNS
ncbi:TldD/PmbA family protein [Alphaproteobacteria bacterium]|jgi:PmbA protein|nr:TldD/PmbA family protein [Alphaproteobacteria bacterium]